jgi:hypothetical protein
VRCLTGPRVILFLGLLSPRRNVVAMAGVLFLLWERSVQSAVPPHLLRAREIIEGLAPSHLPVPLLHARGIGSR